MHIFFFNFAFFISFWQHCFSAFSSSAIYIYSPKKMRKAENLYETRESLHILFTDVVPFSPVVKKLINCLSCLLCCDVLPLQTMPLKTMVHSKEVVGQWSFTCTYGHGWWCMASELLNIAIVLLSHWFCCYLENVVPAINK